jgi:hypothetical protein
VSLPSKSLQQFETAGPIQAAAIESLHPITYLMGPGGSAKTTGFAFKGPHLASKWFPVCRDGVIRVKLTGLRPTYRDMQRTLLESWHSQRLFPKEHQFTTNYEGGQDRPIKHSLKWWTKRGSTMVPVEFEAYFAAIGDVTPEHFAKGFETSFVWMNEADLFEERIPGLMFSRTGRFPAVDLIAPSELDRVMKPFVATMRELGATIDDDELLLPRLLWADCNPPDIDNYVVRWMIDEPEKHKIYKLFRQPSGLSPFAENRKGKPRSSYEQDALSMTPALAQRYVYGEPGYSEDGKPIYFGDFSTAVHVADQPLRPAPNLPVMPGFDAGGSPAGVIGQFMPNGQLRLLAEVCADPGTGPQRFSEMMFEKLLAEFAGSPVPLGYSDPSSWYGADKVAGELAWVEIVAKALSINIQPAPSNEPGLRHDAVRWYLRQRIDANTPGLLIDPRCRRLIGGFAAHYKLTKQGTAGATDRLAVAKNEYSHIHDALQYLCLGHRGRYAVISDAAKIGRPANVVALRAGRETPGKKGWDFDVFAS